MEESLVVFLVRELNNQHNQDGGDDDDDGDFVDEKVFVVFLVHELVN